MAETQGIRAGRAYVEVGTNQSPLDKGLKAAEAKVKAFGDAISGIGVKIGGLGAAITAPLIAATAKFAESGSELAHMSERTGVSVEALSALGYAAKQSGTDMEGVEIAIRKMQKALTAGSLENQQASVTFAQLGLSIQQLQKLRPENQFSVIAKRIASIQDPTAKAGAAMMIFGRAGTTLLPLIEHMGELTDEAKKFGLITSNEASEGALKLEHSMKLVEASLGKLVTTIGSALAPRMTAIAGDFASASKRVLDFVASNKGLVVSVAEIGAGLLAVGGVVKSFAITTRLVGGVLGEAAIAVRGIGAVLPLLATPIGLIGVALAAGTVAWIEWGDGAKVVTDLVRTQFSGVVKDVQDAVKGMGDALAAGDIALAAKILFAELNLEFVKGTTNLIKIWSDWCIALTETFRGVTFNIASLLIDLQANAEKAFSFIKANLSKIPGPVGALVVLGQAAGIIPPDTAHPEGEQADIEKRRAGAQAALLGAEDAEVANRRKAAADAVAAAEAELAAAKIRVRKLAHEAAIAPAEAFGEGGQGGREKGIGGEAAIAAEDLGKGLENAKNKIDIAGGFQAATLPGLGVGKSIQNEQLDEQKKTNTQLEKLNQKAKVGQLVFQP